MDITEIAILSFRSPAPFRDPSFLETWKQCTDAHGEWHADAFPGLPSSQTERAGAIFEQVEDPAKLMITAKWASVEAHWQWIESEENKRAMGAMESYGVSKNPTDIDLFHLDADIFDSAPVEAAGETIALLDSPIIAVDRLFLDPAKKDEFANRLAAVDATLRENSRPFVVRGGWRVDVGPGGRQEYVLVSGWESVDKHLECNPLTQLPESGAFKPLVAEVNTKHYRRIL